MYYVYLLYLLSAKVNSLALAICAHFHHICHKINTLAANYYKTNVASCKCSNSWKCFRTSVCLADLEEVKLCLWLRRSIVVAVKFRQLLLDGRLIHLIQDWHWQVVLQSEISLPMELRHKDLQHYLSLHETFKFNLTRPMHYLIIFCFKKEEIFASHSTFKLN